MPGTPRLSVRQAPGAALWKGVRVEMLVLTSTQGTPSLLAVLVVLWKGVRVEMLVLTSTQGTPSLLAVLVVLWRYVCVEMLGWTSYCSAA